MLAIIRNARKEILPRYDATTRKNESTLVVVVDVDYCSDGTGVVHHSQTYSFLPDSVDPNYFQRQADVMQNDVDSAKIAIERAAVSLEQDQLADRQIAQLLKTPYSKQIHVWDKVLINDAKEGLL